MKFSDTFEEIPCVYKIFNPITGHGYIGSTLQLYSRIAMHYSMLTRRKHENPKLQIEFDEYPSDVFDITILVSFEMMGWNKDLMKKALKLTERKEILKHDLLLNIADNPNKHKIKIGLLHA